MLTTNLQMAEAAHQRGDLARAESCYRRALEIGEADKAGIFYGLGTLALQRGALEDAVDLLRRAVDVAPDAADINFNYALCLKKAGHIEEASAVAIRTAQLCHGDAVFSQVVSKLLLDLNRPAAVVQLLAGSSQSDAGSLILLARAMGALGDWDKSVSLLRQLSDRNQESARVAMELSQSAGKLRDYPLAIASYQRYMCLTQTTAQDHIRFADLYLIARDVTRSIEQLGLAGQAGANSAEYHVLRARLLRLQGDDKSAGVASEEALQLQSGLGQAWMVRVETATREELPQLISRMESSVGTSNYQQVLLFYALADANRLLDNISATASALRCANELQKAGLNQQGNFYDAAKEERNHRLTLTQFNTKLTVSEVLPGCPVPIFVVGMPRSGTTLMEKILGQIEGVTGSGENEAMGFVSAQYQRDVISEELPPPAGMSGAQWQQLARRYHELTPGQSAYIVDKMPFNFLHIGMILSMFPNAKIIQMRREPRDVCLSAYAKPFPYGHNYACDFDALAHMSNEAMVMMEHWQAYSPTRVLDVCFEDLVTNPVQQSQRVTDFCGLPWSEECLNFHRKHSASFTFSEKQVREPINDKPVGQWKAFAHEFPELFSAIESYSI
jgi:tetratricopeptide (TPR) repeat protein